MTKKSTKTLAQAVIAVIVVYLTVPIIATVLYSFATNWTDTVMPEGLTVRWYAQLVGSAQFAAVVGRSLFLGLLTTGLAMAVFLPVVFYVNVYAPALKARLRLLTVLPFTIPAIILVTGLIQVYGATPLPKILILVLALVLLTLPLTYQALDNAFGARDFRALFEQALVLGARPLAAFLQVVVPNIRAGIMVAMLLNFTTAFGEYVLTNLLLGGNFETFKLYMYRLMQSDGQASSVLTAMYFLFLALMSGCTLWLMRPHPRRNRVERHPIRSPRPDHRVGGADDHRQDELQDPA